MDKTHTLSRTRGKKFCVWCGAKEGSAALTLPCPSQIGQVKDAS